MQLQCSRKRHMNLLTMKLLFVYNNTAGVSQVRCNLAAFHQAIYNKKNNFNIC